MRRIFLPALMFACFTVYAQIPPATGKHNILVGTKIFTLNSDGVVTKLATAADLSTKLKTLQPQIAKDSLYIMLGQTNQAQIETLMKTLRKLKTTQYRIVTAEP